MSNNQNNKQVAALLRQIADQIERGDTSAFDAIGPQLRAVLFERKPMQRPTPIPEPPKKPDPPRIIFEDGSPRPMGTVKRKVELIDPVNHTYVSFPHNPVHLSKFAKMQDIRRLYWSGKSKIYSDCLKLFSRYGFIERKGNQWIWSRSFSPLQRISFARQFYTTPRT